tara:strand:+ start:45 stop:359 length:315 start_codon:yes stop_codon:yes gene_type:complete
MAIAITRLSGGTTPADGSDPRTFPAIWNTTATALEALGLDDLTGVSIVSPTTGEVLKFDGANWIADVTAINTDGDPGGKIYAGVADPAVSFTLVAGDIWIEASA